ncbi:MAG: VOC family protein [Proteobacteria bacterium]|nr:VOC family protein [Pseudomonadota bacterium]
MSVIGLDHIQIAMPSGKEAEARSFYANILGLTERDKPPGLANKGGCWFEHGTLNVHLGIDPDFRPAQKAHPGFEVTDLSAITALLEQIGYSISRGSELEGYDRVFTSDPFGNRIELLQKID